MFSRGLTGRVCFPSPSLRSTSKWVFLYGLPIKSFLLVRPNLVFFKPPLFPFSVERHLAHDFCLTRFWEVAPFLFSRLGLTALRGSGFVAGFAGTGCGSFFSHF